MWEPDQCSPGPGRACPPHLSGGSGSRRADGCPQLSYQMELVCGVLSFFEEEFVSGRDFAREERQVVNFGTRLLCVSQLGFYLWDVMMAVA